MEAFDAATLAKKVDDELFMNHLPTHISRLFLHIVEFLRQNEAFPALEVVLNNMGERASIMYERGLFASARKELKKAQTLAKKHANYHQLLRLADLERSFFFLENVKSKESSKDACKFRDLDFVASLVQQLEIKQIHFDLKFYSQTRIGDPEPIKQKLIEILGESLKQHIHIAQTSSTNLLVLDAIGMAAQLDGNFDKAYEAYTRMDALWVSNPDYIVENAMLYISFITKFLNACLVRGRHEEFRSLLANLKTVRFSNEMHALLLREALLYLELIFCLNRFDYDRGLALGPEIDEMIRASKGRISGSRTITLYFNLGSLHFLKADYRKANRYFTQILNLPFQGIRRDVIEFLPFFQLLLFIAMDDHQLVAARLRARTRADSSDRQQVHPLEPAITSLAKSFLRETPKEFKGSIALFRDTIQSLGDIGATVGIGECTFWAEGTLRGKSPGEYFKDYSMGHRQEAAQSMEGPKAV